MIVHYSKSHRIQANIPTFMEYCKMYVIPGVGQFEPNVGQEKIIMAIEHGENILCNQCRQAGGTTLLALYAAYNLACRIRTIITFYGMNRECGRDFAKKVTYMAENITHVSVKNDSEMITCSDTDSKLIICTDNGENKCFANGLDYSYINIVDGLSFFPEDWKPLIPEDMYNQNVIFSVSAKKWHPSAFEKRVNDCLKFKNFYHYYEIPWYQTHLLDYERYIISWEKTIENVPGRRYSIGEGKSTHPNMPNLEKLVHELLMNGFVPRTEQSIELEAKYGDERESMLRELYCVVYVDDDGDDYDWPKSTVTIIDDEEDNDK